MKTSAKPTTAPTSKMSTASSTKVGGTTTAGGATTTAAPPTNTNAAGNIFSGKQIYANPYYASEISTSAIPSLAPSLAAKAETVANTGTFVWL